MDFKTTNKDLLEEPAIYFPYGKPSKKADEKKVAWVKVHFQESKRVKNAEKAAEREYAPKAITMSSADKERYFEFHEKEGTRVLIDKFFNGYISDWGNLTRDGGNDLPFNKESMIYLANEPAAMNFLTNIMYFAAHAPNYGVDVLVEDESDHYKHGQENEEIAGK